MDVISELMEDGGNIVRELEQASVSNLEKCQVLLILSECLPTDVDLILHQCMHTALSTQ